MTKTNLEIEEEKIECRCNEILDDFRKWDLICPKHHRMEKKESVLNIIKSVDKNK